MNRGHSQRVSQRKRCLLYMVAIMLLFAVVSLTAVQAMHTALAMMESNLEENVEELAPILALERLVYRMEREIYFYLASPDSQRAESLLEIGAEMERRFRNVMAAPFGMPAERDAVSEARGEWQQGYRLARNLFATGGAIHPQQKVELSNLGGHLQRVVDSLEQMRRIAHGELEARAFTTEQAVDRARWITLTAMGVGVLLAVATVITLLNSVFGRLGRLEEGTVRLAQGDLSTRVEVEGADEVGHLGETFNTMAERLQRNYQELQQMASRDGLTGLYNRGEIQRRLDAEFARSERYQHPLSLMMIDVDNFKQINDRYGHPAGDEVLRRLAEVLQQQSRPADHLARYGGEEFLVILPEITPAGAMVTAERIRRTVAEQHVQLDDGESIGLTVSIGVATYPQHAQNILELIKRADQAMYRAKESGRNLAISAIMVM